MRGDRPQSLDMAGLAAELVDVNDGQCAYELRPHAGKVRCRQRSLLGAGVETAAWRLSLSFVDPLDLPPESSSDDAPTV